MSVQVKQGILQGTTSKSVLSGKPYYCFLGIPYAKPPLGELRFQPPQPAEPWKGIYDATYEREPAIQKGGFLLFNLTGSEDCLHLNVYTPAIPSEIKSPKAVIVYIHGGGFSIGSGGKQLYSPDYLVEKDVIIVTINHRLHILGFLNLNLPECAGNVGMKDQVLALTWIKENISNFGGDPQNITLLGESAGASAVHYHMISPASKGLFQKAILQSGSSLSPWALSSRPVEAAFRVGRKLGFEGTDPKELLAFFQKQPAKELTLATMEVEEQLIRRLPGKCCVRSFVPSVEKFKEGAFLADIPEKLLRNAVPIPTIFGSNDKEAIYLLNTTLSKELVEKIRDDFDTVVKNNFKIHPSKVSTAAAKIKKTYFGNKEVGYDAKTELVNLYTDILFFRFYDSIEFITKSDVPVYIYHFKYDGQLNTVKKHSFQSDVGIKGASHGDELGYMFVHELVDAQPHYNEEALQVIENVTNLWSHFAKTANPTNTISEISWKPSTEKEACYLTIDKHLQMTKGTVYGKRLQLWKEILDAKEEIYDIPFPNDGWDNRVLKE